MIPLRSRVRCPSRYHDRVFVVAEVREDTHGPLLVCQREGKAGEQAPTGQAPSYFRPEQVEVLGAKEWRWRMVKIDGATQSGNYECGDWRVYHLKEGWVAMGPATSGPMRTKREAQRWAESYQIGR